MVLYAVIFMGMLGLVLGLALGYASSKLKVREDPVVEKIDAVLPQIQCGQCGFPGCRPYADAIANDKADINRCVPGGDDVIRKLAELLNRPAKPLAVDTPPSIPTKGVAFIHEDQCIGCTRCIQVCPVECIAGAARCMHTVIRQQCTGCSMCVSACPVDCIQMMELQETLDNWQWKKPDSKKTDFIFTPFQNTQL